MTARIFGWRRPLMPSGAKSVAVTTAPIVVTAPPKLCPVKAMDGSGTSSGNPFSSIEVESEGFSSSMPLRRTSAIVKMRPCSTLPSSPTAATFRKARQKPSWNVQFTQGLYCSKRLASSSAESVLDVPLAASAIET